MDRKDVFVICRGILSPYGHTVLEFYIEHLGALAKGGVTEDLPDNAGAPYGGALLYTPGAGSAFIGVDFGI